jgi:chemotaxis protein MotB
MANAQPIIIKRIHKGEHGHHGGAWKVAYADFVTAMMAFFLLLWLLNVTTDEQKSGIADYFAPSAASRSESGSGAILGGQTMSAQGSRVSNNAPPTVVMVMTPPPRERPADTNDQGGAMENSEGKAQEKREGEESEQGEKARDLTERELQEKLMEREQKAFAETAQRLKEVVENVPGLAELKKNILIDNTPEGLRIQLVDQDGNSMFSRGSASMSEQTRMMLGKIAEVTARLPNRISITGHTDAMPFRTAGGYGNWELSADRANASRRVLTEAGLGPERVAEVSGKAETEPLVREDPFQPSNRRISIVLLREAGMTATPSLPKQFQQPLANGRKP